MSDNNRLHKLDFLNSLKMSGCSLCGYKGCLRALHFHHVEPNKELTLSSGKGSWPAVKREVQKCIVVCSNCHAEIHEGLIEGVEHVQTVRLRDIGQLRFEM